MHFYLLKGEVPDCIHVLTVCIDLAPIKEIFYNTKKELLKKAKVDAIISFLKAVGLYRKI